MGTNELTEIEEDDSDAGGEEVAMSMVESHRSSATD